MYKSLKTNKYENNHGYMLTPIRECDIELIRLWRNGQLDILRQNEPLSQETQQKYFKDIIAPSFADPLPNQILFSFLQNNLLIGYGGLTHIDWHSKQAELSFLLNTAIQEQSPEFALHFSHFLKILLDIAFKELSLHKIVAEVFDLRPQMPELLERAGFKLEKVLQDHVFKQGTWHNAYLFGLTGN